MGRASPKFQPLAAYFRAEDRVPGEVPARGARLATSPVLKGSPMPTAIMGIVVVACFAARAALIPAVTITAT